MSFTTTELVNNRVLVEGTDRLGILNRTVLDTTQFNELYQSDQHAAAHEAFDAAVDAFYAPLLEAVEAFDTAHAAARDEDLFEVVVQEAVEPTAGQPEIRRRLTQDTVILRLIEQGDDDRLIWIGDSLEITKPAVVDALPEISVPDDVTGVESSEPTA